MPGLVPGIRVLAVEKDVDGGQASLRSLPKVGCEPGHVEEESLPRASMDHFGVFPLQWHYLNAQAGNSRLVWSRPLAPNPHP